MSQPESITIIVNGKQVRKKRAKYAVPNSFARRVVDQKAVDHMVEWNNKPQRTLTVNRPRIRRPKW